MDENVKDQGSPRDDAAQASASPQGAARKPREEDDGTNYMMLCMSCGLALGSGVGMSMGLLFNQIVMGVALGISGGLLIGLAIGATLDKRRK